MTSVFHVSDLHFGWPAVPEQIEAIERIMGTRPTPIVVCGVRFSVVVSVGLICTVRTSS